MCVHIIYIYTYGVFYSYLKPCPQASLGSPTCRTYVLLRYAFASSVSVDQLPPCDRLFLLRFFSPFVSLFPFRLFCLYLCLSLPPYAMLL